MSIIPYKTKDSTPVASFFREIFRELGWEERDSDHMDKPHLLFHLPEKGVLFLVKEKEKVIGTGGFIVLNDYDGLIKRFYVAKSYRGTGIAQKLLYELIKKAKLLGLKRLILDVSKDNSRAIRFYEKNGYIKTQVAPQEGWPESFTPETHYFFYKLI